MRLPALPSRLALGVVVVVLAGGVAAWRGHEAGYAKAAALGDAALARLESSHARAYAETVEALNARLQEQARTALDVSHRLEIERKSHVQTQARLQARIAAVARNSRHVFDADFVRLFNEAAGADPSSLGDALPCALDSPGSSEAAAACQTAAPRLVAGGAAGGVTEADLLAWMTCYGARTRDLEAQLCAWIELAKDWK